MISARKLAVLKSPFAGTSSGFPPVPGRGRWRLGAPVFLLTLPLIALTGCFHRQPPPPPPAASGPPALPGSMTTIPSVPPSMPAPGKPDVALTDPKPAPAAVPPAHTRRVLHKKRVTDGSAPAAPGSAAGTAPATPATAATGAPADSSAAAAGKPPELGQLSAGNSADTKELSSMIEQIHTLEMRLANLKHSQNSDEEATELQIRLFLAKARQATISNDLDGARTLALKAKVLLDELTNL